MKIKTLAIALLFIAGTVGAQITDRGNFIIGGTLGFSTASSNVEQNLSGENTAFEGSTSTQFNIAPSIGYFLVRNFAVGVGMDYTFNAVEDPDGSMEDDSDLLFGPFMRLYLPISDDMSFFLESTAGFGSSSNTSTIDGANQNISTDVFAFGVGPGFTIFSSNAVGIEALVKYNYARSNADFEVNAEKVNVLTTTNQFDFSVGLQFYFTRVGIAPAGR